MPVHRVVTFRVPHDLDEVYELVSRPRDFFSLLPILLEFRSFRGNDVIAYLNAFGFKSTVILSFTVMRWANRFTLESSVIGELILGFVRPPSMDVSFRVNAVRVEGGTEITFEVYVRSSYFKERAASRETEELVRRIPEIFSSALMRAPAAPGIELPREVRPELAAAPPTPPTEAEARAAVEVGAERREGELEAAPRAPAPVEEGARPVGFSDRYSALLEDPLAVYRLTTSGRPVTTFRAKYSSQLIDTLSRASLENQCPVYAVLRGSSQTARLIVDGNEIAGALLEREGQVLKGEGAVKLLEQSEEEYLCAVFAVDRKVLESSG